MSIPRSPRGVDSITLGTITPLGSIISRVALIHLGSFGLKMVPIFSPYNIRNDLSLFLLYWRSQTIGKTECAEEPYKSKVMYRYHSTWKSFSLAQGELCCAPKSSSTSNSASRILAKS